jgi:tetratricopeptide (TPR) repeat protein
MFVLYRQLRSLEASGAAMAAVTLAPHRNSARLAQMTTYADRLFAEKKWLAAEKAYLAVLKVDHKNVTAYSHLGIIYSTQKNMPDAIECFEIAARLHPSGTTLQNLGLAFFDNHNYIKSIAAFEKAIMFEPTAQRYVGLSRAHRKLSNLPASVDALEKAAALDPTARILETLAEAYEEAGLKDKAIATRRRQSAPSAAPHTVAS